MASEDEKVKLKFDLANANLQSIGRAQGLYLTTLLIYICLVWAMFLTGRGESHPGEALTIHLGWLDLKANAVWKVTPFITMVLTLAVAGTLNAAVSSYKQVQELGKELLGSEFGAMFEVDTHKNVIDYLALLQVIPWGKTRKPADSRGHDPFWRRLKGAAWFRFEPLVPCPYTREGEAYAFWAWRRRNVGTSRSSAGTPRRTPAERSTTRGLSQRNAASVVGASSESAQCTSRLLKNPHSERSEESAFRQIARKLQIDKQKHIFNKLLEHEGWVLPKVAYATDSARRLEMLEPEIDGRACLALRGTHVRSLVLLSGRDDGARIATENAQSDLANRIQ